MGNSGKAPDKGKGWLAPRRRGEEESINMLTMVSEVGYGAGPAGDFAKAEVDFCLCISAQPSDSCAKFSFWLYWRCWALE